MNNFHIITNDTKDQERKITNHIKRFLESHGKTCAGDPARADCALVLGGDGTLLRAAGALSHLHLSFLGINLGTLGFLAEVNENNIDRALTQIIAGEYEIEERMMLEGFILPPAAAGEKPAPLKSGGKDSGRDCALNDVVIAGHIPMQLIYFDLYVNDLLLTGYAADGMIVSTPTGSTAYNLSAGGPVFEPRAEAILLTPICSHSLRSRSIILSADDEVMIEISGDKYGKEQTAVAIFDGHCRATLKTGDRIKITKSERTTSIVKLSKMNFLEILKQKL